MEFLGEYINERELAKELGERLRGKAYNVRTLIEWRRHQVGPPARQVGKTWVYRIADVEAWIKSREVSS